MTAPSVSNPVRPANGVLNLRSELWTASPSGNLRENITADMVSATVSYKWDDDVPGTMNATLRGDAARSIIDCLVPILVVEWLDAQGERQRVRERLGLFFFLPPDRTYTRTTELVEIQGNDATWALGELTLGKDFPIKKDSSALGVWAREMFLSSGRTNLRTSFPETLRKPGKYSRYPPNANTKASINDLYARAGYWPMTAERNGLLTTSPRRLISFQESARIIRSRWGDVVNAGGVKLVPDRESFFNQVYISSNNPQDELTMRDGMRVTLVDPDSPFSVPNLGYVRSVELADNKDETPEGMRARAMSMLERCTAMMARLSFAVLPDPRFSPRDVWDIEIRMDTGVVMGRGKWRVESTSFALAQGSAAQVVTLGKLSDVTKVY